MDFNLKKRKKRYLRNGLKIQEKRQKKKKKKHSKMNSVSKYPID